MVSIVPRTEEAPIVQALMKLWVAKKKEDAKVNPTRAPNNRKRICWAEGSEIDLRLGT